MGYAAYSVKVVSDDSTAETSLGSTSVGPPMFDHEVTIYTLNIKLHKGGLENLVIRDIIGHEIGHCAHIEHCPVADVQIDANGKANWEDQCRMWPAYDMDQSEYASHHDRDYALRIDIFKPQNETAPQEPYELPDEEDDEDEEQRPSSSIVSANGSYTAEAGDSHTANFTTSEPYSSVYWYVKTPSDTSTYGTTVEIDQGGGSTTTASMSYTFPSGTSGDYVIMAYVYGGNSNIYEESYTVTVTALAPILIFSPSLSISGSYSAGGAISVVVTCEAPIYEVHLFVRTPGDLSTYGTRIVSYPGTTTTTTMTLPYTFPTDAPGGEYKITARVYPWDGNTYGAPYYLIDYVTVSSSIPPLIFAPTLSITLNAYRPGDTLSLVVTSELPIYGAHLYVRVPGAGSVFYGTQIG